jgi:trans-2,3-dihydro-3-hydroxyanthranilate isomerase
VSGASVQHAVAFADGAGGGNPCPVVFGAGGWDDAAMQAAAAAFGHETCFVLDPPAAGAADVALRYFVPNHEMEMCVHATVAATVLLGLPDGARVATPLGVRRVWRPGPSRALVEQFAPRLGPAVADVAPVLAALGAADGARGEGPVRSVSTARAKLMVPLRDEAALDALVPDVEALWSLCEALAVTGVYAFTTAARGADAAARQFPLRAGYDEDPATGVAACALACHLAPDHDGTHAFTIAQGRAMGRPSLIEAEAVRREGAIVATRVGGTAEATGEREPLDPRG